MKKYVIELDQIDRKLEVKFPYQNEIGLFQNLTNLLNYTFFKLATLLILSIPVSGLLISDERTETSSFIVIISLLILLVGLHLFRVILYGSKVVIDPKGIFQVMVFALLLTISAVLLSEPNTTYTENTFGAMFSSSPKGFSGLAVIAYVSFFYTVSLFIYKRKSSLAKIPNLLFLSFLAYTFGFLFEIVDIDYISIPLLMVSLFVFGYKLLTDQSKIGKYFGFLGIIAAFIAIFSNTEFQTEELTIYLFAFLLSSIPACFVFAKESKNTILDLLQQLLDGVELAINSIARKNKKFSNYFQWVRPVMMVILIMLPLMSLLGIMFILSIERELVVFTDLFESIQNSFDSISYDFQTLLVGTGSSNVSKTGGMIASVIQGQGLTGLIAYIFIWTFTVGTIFKTLGSKLFSTKEDFKKSYLLFSSTSIFILVLSLFFYPGFSILILWWLSLVLINSSNHVLEIKFSNPDSLKVKPFSIFENKKAGVLAKKLLSVISLISTVAVLAVFINLVGDVI